MKILSALRRVKSGTHTLAAVRADLQQHGYQTQLLRPVSGRRYLRFHGQFEDLSEMTGLLDLASWASAALPALDGIDWLSVEDRVLHPLIAEHPLQLVLSPQHAPLINMNALELMTNANNADELPVVEASPGNIFIERFTPQITTDASEIPTLSHLQIPVTFSIGYSVLPCHTLTTIEVGDVLLITHRESHASSHGTPLFTIKFNREAIMILNQTDNEETPHDAFDQPATNNKTGLNALPVELSVVLMEKVMPLAQLKAITPGEIISLPPNAMLNVEIRANKHCFARGELVQLEDGQLGVEIRTLCQE